MSLQSRPKRRCTEKKEAEEIEKKKDMAAWSDDEYSKNDSDGEDKMRKVNSKKGNKKNVARKSVGAPKKGNKMTPRAPVRNPFKLRCNQCKKAVFYGQQYLDAHMAKEHGPMPTGAPIAALGPQNGPVQNALGPAATPYKEQCKLCLPPAKFFAYGPAYMVQHMAKKHGPGQVNVPEKLQCNHCNAHFYKQSNLDCHTAYAHGLDAPAPMHNMSLRPRPKRRCTEKKNAEESEKKKIKEEVCADDEQSGAEKNKNSNKSNQIVSSPLLTTPSDIKEPFKERCPHPDCKYKYLQYFYGQEYLNRHVAMHAAGVQFPPTVHVPAPIGPHLYKEQCQYCIPPIASRFFAYHPSYMVKHMREKHPQMFSTKLFKLL